MLPQVKVTHPHVELNDVGVPIVMGTRVPVARLWSWHRRGVTFETLFRRYPSLSPAKILDSVSFAYDNPELIAAAIARENEILNAPGDIKQLPLKPKE